MRKAFILAATAIAIFSAWSVKEIKQKRLENQQQGILNSFQILNYQIHKQRQTLKQINQNIDYTYNTFINYSLEDFNYGIGGYEAQIKFVPYADLINNTHKQIKINEALTNVTEQKLIRTYKLAKYIKDSLNHTPSIRPLPLDSVYAISSFGIRLHPILHKFMMHEGVDYAAPVGTPVYATADGIVVESSYDPITGQYVKIEHGYGYTTLYGHLSKRVVLKGERVKKGQIIGYVGNTGRSVGPHLHYEVRVYGIPVNPLKFISDPIEAEQLCAANSKRSKSVILAR